MRRIDMKNEMGNFCSADAGILNVRKQCGGWRRSIGKGFEEPYDTEGQRNLILGHPTIHHTRAIQR